MTRPDDRPVSEKDLFDALEITFPVFEMAKMRWRSLEDRNDPNWTGLNVFWHQGRLSTAEDRWVTTPNNDTLYSIAWVDLAQGPVRITIPATDGRYLNLAMVDMYSNNFECLSRRDIGSGGTELILVGADWSGALPRGQAVVQAPGIDAMLVTRSLVNDEPDVAAARRVQHGFSVSPLGTTEAPKTPVRGTSSGQDFALLVRDALTRNPPRTWEADVRALLRKVGLFESEEAIESDGEPWTSLLPAFLARVREDARRFAVPVDHWVYSPPEMGNFGTSYRLRAAAALGGLGILPGSEAIYISTEFDSEDRVLHGDGIYCLELPASGLPADAFWSLTLYEKMPSGARFLARNRLDRYAFSDRTKTLQSIAGRTFVWASNREPPPGLESNWLPAPEAPFRFALRLYHPRPEVRAGMFRMKPVRRFDSYEMALLAVGTDEPV